MSSNIVPSQKKKWYEYWYQPELAYNISVKSTLGYGTGYVVRLPNSKSVKKQGNGDIKRHCDETKNSKDNKSKNAST